MSEQSLSEQLQEGLKASAEVVDAVAEVVTSEIEVDPNYRQGLIKEGDASNEILEGKASASHKPEDAAAAFFQMNEIKLTRLSKNLSLNQLRRVFMHVALGGIGKTQYKLIGDEERQAAYAFNELVEQKAVMRMALEWERVAEAHKKEQEELALKNAETVSTELTAETQTEVNEGVTNG